MEQQEVVKFERECVWREDYANEGMSGDAYEKRDAGILNLPAPDHNHFDSARDVHGALCSV